MLEDNDGGFDGGGRLAPLLAGAREPRVWLPPVLLAVAGAVLAQVVQPWPEGRILLTVRGLGPHGITTSDVVVVAVSGLLTLAWVRAVWPSGSR